MKKFSQSSPRRLRGAAANRGGRAIASIGRDPIPDPGMIAALYEWGADPPSWPARAGTGDRSKSCASFPARAQPRQGHHRNGFVRFFVFGRCLQLSASEIGGDDVFAVTQIEIQGTPVDGDLARPDAEEPAKVDHRGTRLAATIEQDVDDPAHILAGSAHHVFAENAK